MEPGMSDPPRTAATDILRTVRAPATTLNETGQVDPSLASRERPIALEFLRLDVTYERACRGEASATSPNPHLRQQPDGGT
jgi:hypothetical protein